MLLNVYSVYDSAVCAYGRPFFLQADGQALRVFEDVCVSADSDIAKHPKDYSLFRIGRFNDNEGRLIAEDRVCLITAIEAVAKSRVVLPAQPGLFEQVSVASNGAKVGDFANFVPKEGV